MTVAAERDVLDDHDPAQQEMMKERVILVNEKDECIGYESKKNSHLSVNCIEGNMLHRAFSVFLFNARGELLLQQRAAEKITFPLHWTNTVCSHPLQGDEEELREQLGVRRAAQRKLEHELGVPAEQVPLAAFDFMTRIHYQAPSDATWGEHELDHILFLRTNGVDLRPNPNEVAAFRYVTQAQLKELLESHERDGLLVTPWFRLICNRFLFGWWDNLHALDGQKDPLTIHRLR